MEARGCIGSRVGVGGEGMMTTFVGSEEEREVNLNELNRGKGMHWRPRGGVGVVGRRRNDNDGVRWIGGGARSELK